MLQFIRKHQLLGGILLFLVIASFIVFMIPGADPTSLFQGGRVTGLGAIDGEPVREDELYRAQRMTYFATRIFSNRQADNEAEQREVYNRLIIQRTLDKHNILVPPESVASEIKNVFRDPTTGQFSKTFYDGVVAQLPRGYTEEDMHDFFRQNLGLRQLASTMTLADTLVTPLEGKELSKREKRKAKAKLVVFKGTNFTAKVELNEPDLLQYYTNNMASYRTTEQRAVTLVEFAPTNFMAQAETDFKDLQTVVDNEYKVTGDTMKDAEGNPLPEAEAKAQIKDSLLSPRSSLLAKQQAYEFTKDVIEQTSSTNLVHTNKLAIFKSQALLRGLNPTDTDYFNQFGRISEKNPGSDGVKSALDAGPEINTAAFRLTLSNPFPNEPIESVSSWYFIGLNEIKPSEVQPYEQVKFRVESGFKRDKERELLREEAESLYQTLTNELAGGSKTFEHVATNAGYEVIDIPEFDIQTTTLTNFNSAVSLGTIKNTVFGLAPGEVSNFVPSGQNGYIVQLEEFIEPSEEDVMADYTNSIPRIKTQMRLGGGGFSDWMAKQMSEAGFNTAEESQ